MFPLYDPFPSRVFTPLECSSSIFTTLFNVRVDMIDTHSSNGGYHACQLRCTRERILDEDEIYGSTVVFISWLCSKTYQVVFLSSSSFSVPIQTSQKWKNVVFFTKMSQTFPLISGIFQMHSLFLLRNTFVSRWMYRFSFLFRCSLSPMYCMYGSIGIGLKKLR